MKKIIMIDGEVLGNNVIINKAFDAIYKISPSILKYFIKLIDKIDDLDCAVSIDSYTFPDINSINIEFSNENFSGSAFLSFKMKNCMLELIDSSLRINDGSASKQEFEEEQNINSEIVSNMESKTETELACDLDDCAVNKKEEFEEPVNKNTDFENDKTENSEETGINELTEDSFVENTTEHSRQNVEDIITGVLPKHENQDKNADYQVPTVEVNHEKVKQILEAKRNGLKKFNTSHQISSQIQEKSELENVGNESITRVDIIENDAMLLGDVFESQEGQLNETIKEAIINRPKISITENNENVSGLNVERLNKTVKRSITKSINNSSKVYSEDVSSEMEKPETESSSLSDHILPINSGDTNADIIEETNQADTKENAEMLDNTEDDTDNEIDIYLIIEKLKENKIKINKQQIEEIITEYKKTENPDEISEERLINYIKYFHGYDRQLALNKLSKLKNAIEQITEKEISTMDVLNMQLKLLNKDTEEKMIRVIDRDTSVDLYQLGDDVSMSKDKIYLWGDTLYLEE